MAVSEFSLHTHTLQYAPWGALVTRVLQAALQAVEPGAAVRRHIQRQKDILTAGGQTYDLRQYRRIFVLGCGKAGAPMAQAAAELLVGRLQSGLVIVKEGHLDASKATGPIQLCEASHPLPDIRSLQHTRTMLELLGTPHQDDLVLCLISGGGSALMTQPAPGISLTDLQQLTHLLLACGASIHEINTLRKHLDLVKGGGLARRLAPAQVLVLVLSDVVGDPLDVIASGPCVPDSSSYADCLAILDHYDLFEKVPSSILQRLRGGLEQDFPETAKPGDPVFERVQHILVGSNLQAAQAAVQAAAAEGLNAQLLTSYLQSEARQAGMLLGAIARQIAATGQPVPRPACLVAGGETTVTLIGKGKGGRNQELALAALRTLAGLPDMVLVTLATDGGDGPTDAAGAVVSGESLARARQLCLDPDQFLANNDAYPFFEQLGDLLKPGPTQTNVCDLSLIFAF